MKGRLLQRRLLLMLSWAMRKISRWYWEVHYINFCGARAERMRSGSHASSEITTTRWRTNNSVLSTKCWYFRILIWTRFLWHVSRIKLSLMPTHPDRVGGLGFLSNTVYAFSVLVVAHGVMVSSQIANRIFFLGADLREFEAEIAMVAIFLLCLIFGPMLVFVPQLAQAKRTGLREYGTLAETYVRDFDRKWLRRAKPEGEVLIGSADIQSLADLANSFEVVRSMRLVLVNRDAILQLAAALLLPLLPLVLTIMPLKELLTRLAGIVF